MFDIGLGELVVLGLLAQLVVLRQLLHRVLVSQFGSGRGELGVTLLVQTPSRLDDHQRDLLRQLAEARGENKAEVSMERHHKSGVFSWLKDAFTQ